MEIPKQYQDLVGQKKILSGGLFSYKRSEPEQEYDILDIRFGSATIMSMKELEEMGESSYEHPTFELLVKREGMRQARWTRSFPIREINLKDEKVEQ